MVSFKVKINCVVYYLLILCFVSASSVSDFAVLFSACHLSERPRQITVNSILCNALASNLVFKPRPNKPLIPSAASINDIVSVYVVFDLVDPNDCFVVLITLILLATVSLTILDMNPIRAFLAVDHSILDINLFFDNRLYV